jgi:hypothetical protein
MVSLQDLAAIKSEQWVSVFGDEQRYRTLKLPLSPIAILCLNRQQATIHGHT